MYLGGVLSLEEWIFFSLCLITLVLFVFLLWRFDDSTDQKARLAWVIAAFVLAFVSLSHESSAEYIAHGVREFLGIAGDNAAATRANWSISSLDEFSEALRLALGSGYAVASCSVDTEPNDSSLCFYMNKPLQEVDAALLVLSRSEVPCCWYRQYPPSPYDWRISHVGRQGNATYYVDLSDPRYQLTLIRVIEGPSPINVGR